MLRKEIALSADSEQLDVVIVGAGLAGTTLAGALARTGIRVALVDLHATYPADFRAEKFAAHEMAQFEALGWGATARACTTTTEAVHAVRFGRFAKLEPGREYGIAYADLVGALRADLPPEVALTIGRVSDLAFGPETQSVTMSDGRRLQARLVVLATGLGDALRRKAGIVRQMISRQHSVALGFDMAAPRGAFRFEALHHAAERHGNRDAYLTLFPLGDTMRANLFGYWDMQSPRLSAFKADPAAALLDLMPGLPRFCPDPRIAGRVEMRPIDLIRVADPVREGFVLIGDAFQTACPVTGTGVRKLLTDVERLMHHIPDWLRTAGMGTDKIARFYADETKIRVDVESLRLSLYVRQLNTDARLPWSMRRGGRTIRNVLQIPQTLRTPWPRQGSAGR
jgi:2-polyprenyl-6-methoxyphenol hydroxylase-like FAD-dependent oxidoreductase